MPRTYSFAFRRKNPSMFPEVCPICTPQRRFELPFDKARHDFAKHGIGTNPREPRKSFTPTTLSSTSFSRYSYSGSLSMRMASAVSQPRSKLYSISTMALNEFVKDEIEPDNAYNASCLAVINRLCQFMKNNFPDDLRPAEIIKSGSLGKGTAVKGKSDADLVVFLSSPRYGSIANIRQSMTNILDRMAQYLRVGECVYEGKTPHAVKVSLSCHVGYSLDVDILPSVNILQKEQKSQIYEKMKNNLYDREYYSAALAPLQLDFVSRSPTKLKTLIRLMKYWRKTAFEESTTYKRLPSSYPLELITIGEWENVGKPSNFDLRKGFYNVLRALVNYKTLAYIWTVNYNVSDVSSSYHPYVIDPANPFNNVMESCNCWDEVADEARECLNKPLFSDLHGIVGWM